MRRVPEVAPQSKAQASSQSMHGGEVFWASQQKLTSGLPLLAAALDSSCQVEVFPSPEYIDGINLQVLLL